MAEQNIEPIIIRPQIGFQENFLSSSADLIFGGGAVSGGKSYALLLEALRGIHDPNYTAAIFRRTNTEIRTPGGLFDTACNLYGKVGAVVRESQLDFTFPSGCKIKLASVEDEKSLQSWQGSQICYLAIDEVSNWSEKMVWYLTSRNRSLCSIKPYMRLTGNPNPDSFLAKFIEWWLDDTEFGFPRKDRAGVIRYFIRLDDKVIWGDTKEELELIYGDDCMPKSFTFIPATIYDNKILLENNRDYLASLKALNYVDRMQLLEGAWRIKPSAGLLFKREWFKFLDAIPGGWVKAVRFWDRAATPIIPGKSPNPDFTIGLLLLKYPNNTFVIADVKRMRDTPLKVEQLILNTVTQDGYKIKIRASQDPASAGVAEASMFTRLLAGYDVATSIVKDNKVTRAKGISAQCEAGNVSILKAEWNAELLRELEGFPDKNIHDDSVDCLSGAFIALTQHHSILDVL